MDIITDITVAGLAETGAGILTVREVSGGRVVLNLPGGHMESGEVPEQTVVREFREETGEVFEPAYLLGCYAWLNPVRQRRYLRLVYAGRISETVGASTITDPNIVSAQWLAINDILKCTAEHRYPIVAKSIEDYRAGKRLTDSDVANSRDEFSLENVELLAEQL